MARATCGAAVPTPTSSPAICAKSSTLDSRRSVQTDARRWYWGEALRSCIPLAARRWSLSDQSRATSRNGDSMWSPMLDDVRYAARLARRTPLASLAVVATMVLGIGSTTAVFSAMNAIVLKPLPFPESSRVVRLKGVVRNGLEIESMAYPDLMDFRRTVPDFAELTFYQRADQTLQHGSDPQLMHIVQVDETYPRVFGTRVALGRWLAPADLALNAPKVALLSHAFWMREFGGDRAIVGRTITLDNESVQVIGFSRPTHTRIRFRRPMRSCRSSSCRTRR